MREPPSPPSIGMAVTQMVWGEVPSVTRGRHPYSIGDKRLRPPCEFTRLGAS